MMQTQEKFETRVRELIADEEKQPLGWWYLSYADAEGFRGGVIIEARGFTSAVLLANVLKASPGGEVRGLKIPPEHVPAEKYRMRLLTLEELREVWGDMETLDVLEGRARERES